VPTYQYLCTECGDQVEAVQKFTDDPLTVHDDCGGRLRKVFSPVGIVFKGSGFYRTDSRNGSGNGKDKPTKAGESAASSGDGGSSADSKKSGPAGDAPGSGTGDGGGSGDSKPAKKAETASAGGSSSKVA